MQVQYFAAAATFMKIIDVLCDNVHIKICFQVCQSSMCCIGIGSSNISPAEIIKFKYQCRVFLPAPGRSYFINIVAFPESIAVAKV